MYSKNYTVWGNKGEMKRTCLRDTILYYGTILVELFSQASSYFTEIIDKIHNFKMKVHEFDDLIFQ